MIAVPACTLGVSDSRPLLFREGDERVDGSSAGVSSFVRGPTPARRRRTGPKTAETGVALERRATPTSGREDAMHDPFTLGRSLGWPRAYPVAALIRFVERRDAAVDLGGVQLDGFEV
jgi:hypothetical protein